MMSKVMFWCMVTVISVTMAMSYVVYEDYFKRAKVENEDGHYAETVHDSLKPFLPTWIKMPFNTIVNIGYVIVGAAWCATTTVALDNKKISSLDARMLYVFNLLSCCYGPIQAIRILTQTHEFGVLDQWYTLPFFMWVFLWGTTISYGWSTLRVTTFMTLSICSYISVLYSDIGFEICLAIHICFAILGAMFAWLKVPQAKCGRYFALAILACCGFVVIKLLDLELVKVHKIFKYISGHFISKIFDVLQIHHSNQFFYSIMTASIIDSKKKKQ